MPRLKVDWPLWVVVGVILAIAGALAIGSVYFAWQLVPQ